MLKSVKFLHHALHHHESCSLTISTPRLWPSPQISDSIKPCVVVFVLKVLLHKSLRNCIIMKIWVYKWMGNGSVWGFLVSLMEISCRNWNPRNPLGSDVRDTSWLQGPKSAQCIISIWYEGSVFMYLSIFGFWIKSLCLKLYVKSCFLTNWLF